MVREHGDVLRTSRIHLQHEGTHGGLSVEGEHSSMVEYVVTLVKHGRLSRVMGTV